jgi:hypothetical protein
MTISYELNKAVAWPIRKKERPGEEKNQVLE